jgi:hypothetical protein
MTNGRQSDLLETLEVLQGRRSVIEDQQTWLRHDVESQAGKIDLYLLRGASVVEMARAIPCREGRVRDHFNHLQDGPSTMEPHHLRLRNANGIWIFDRDWLEQQFLR